MCVICSYCRRSLDGKPPTAQDEVVPDLCRSCDAHFERKWEGLSLGEYLDAFPDPVLVVDSDGRILAANEAMAEKLGRVDRQTRGLLGGEVMECAYARLPGGCGKTVHCQTCGIRRAVETTFSTGQGQERVEVNFEHAAHGTVPMAISTRRVGPAVFVTLPARAA